MPPLLPRLAVVLPALLLLAACGPAREQQRTARLLNDRLDMRLSSDVAANRAFLCPAPDGAQVTLLDASPSPGGPAVSDPNDGSVRAGVIEALLDPSLMRISVADTSSLPPEQKAERIANLEDYFRAMALGDVLRPGDAAQPPAAGPPGLTLTISVACPHRRDGSGYGDGKRKPGCF
jgi:hypothetical protein